MESWQEIDDAKQDGRHELHLNGEIISDKLKRCEGKIPDTLFKLTSLNYLEISDTTLSNLPPHIGKLTNLLNLALHRNQITEIPQDINNLSKLKFMDVSFNRLSVLPSEFTMPQLHTLNLSNNELTSLPDFTGMTGLSTVHIDHNQLTALPVGLETLGNVSEIHASNNNIATFPDVVSQMVNIKHLDVSENALKEISCDFSKCLKLKTLDLKNNPLKDNRLKKMTVQCSTKAVLEYLAKQSSDGGGGGKKGKGKKKGKGAKRDEEDEDEDTSMQRKFHVLKAEEALRVDMNTNVKDTRPYICCALVKDLDLSDPAMFKAFITLQTKLHENVCDMRTRATIATHNFPDLIFPLTYEALPVESIEIVPLGKEKVSAAQLITNLKADRDNLKTQKKRAHKSGLYKFLDLVDGKEKLSVLRDANADVVSLPPLTNSEKTKIQTIVSDVFIEITSPMSLPDSKFVMEKLLEEMFKIGLSSKCEDKVGLVVQPIRVFDESGDLKIIYPSKVDLNVPGVSVVRVE